MRAVVFHGVGKALRLEDLDIPKPGPGQVLVKVEACGVCRTDLHIIDGELTKPALPLILGHEVVGRVQDLGAGVSGFAVGTRVGVPWLGRTCGTCPYCDAGMENLCDHAAFTGYDLNGGYAEYCVADARSCFALDDPADPVKLAPLLCAGLIGYRALRMAGPGNTLGIYGFGAAAHIVAQIARHEGWDVFAFTRPGDTPAQSLAMGLGCQWAGDSDTLPPEELDAAIIFAPVGGLVPAALRAVRKAGTVVCGGIHMSDIPSFEYKLLWGERVLRSVANLTREDAVACLEVARRIPIHTQTQVFPLDAAEAALQALRAGTITGAAVLVP
jgi:propanol-preferring alcohol dehydrogenase